MKRDTNANEPNRTIADISHTSPYTGDSTGQLFARGPTIAADGGRSMAEDEATDERETTAQSDRTMKSMSHTPPTAPPTDNGAFERGVRDTDEDHR